jgi:hypothetical protein
MDAASGGSRRTFLTSIIGAAAMIAVMMPGGATTSAFAQVPDPDVSACPTAGTELERLADPLEGPVADDPLEDNPPQGFEAPASAAAAAGSPANPDLKPILRPPGKASVAAAAAAAADSSAVELTLRWCLVQRSGAETYDWTYHDAVFNEFVAAGVALRTLRVVDAPSWAATQECRDLAARGAVSKCPPRADVDPKLRAFARAVAVRYGPGTTYDVDRLAFWNEPNTPENWGASQPGNADAARARAHRYSDRLAAFSAAATSAKPQIKIDAGEVAAGGPADRNGARPWAVDFARYNTDQNRADRFEMFTIHPYSQFASQIPLKVASYRELPGVNQVAVTELAWGVDESADRHWKCTSADAAQATRFESLMDAVVTTDVPIARLVWFSAVDNRKGEGSKCSTQHYDATIRDQMNTFGLFKRPASGQIDTFSQAIPRPLSHAFAAAQD